MKVIGKRPPFAVITAAAVMLLWWPKLEAQDDSYYKRQVRAYLSRSTEITFLVNHGFKYLTDGEREGYIRLNSYQDATWQAEAGYSYAFTGVCDNDAATWISPFTTRMEGRSLKTRMQTTIRRLWCPSRSREATRYAQRRPAAMR